MFVPIQFEKNIPHYRPVPVQINKRNAVLWRDANGSIKCMEDRCPHRWAKLSQGTITDGFELECPYHGWRFRPDGTCAHIPQLPRRQDNVLPRACNARSFHALTHDGIVWISMGSQKHPSMQHVEELRSERFLDHPDYLVTDVYMEAPYNMFLQIENLLDPAHIHFVHNGFQGRKANACPLKVHDVVSTDDEISGHIQHIGRNDMPRLHIRFLPHRSMVDVSIFSPYNDDLVRKNIIFMSAIDEKRCNVMFRDVAVKKNVLDHPNPFVENHLKLLFQPAFVDAHFPIVNRQVVDKILEQDVNVLIGQQINMESIGKADLSYLDATYVLPSESDRLIVEFRKWCRRNSTKFCLS